MNTSNNYDRRFYQKQIDGSAQSASVILPIVFDIIKPRSVLDFGCGAGTWLSVARSLGAEKVTGIDGPWVKPDVLQISQSEFQPIDLEEQKFPDLGHFDLAISMEVLEHLSESAAEEALYGMSRSANFILLSVAIPGQGGNNHVNEQWQGYYANFLINHGFEIWDVVRPKVWHDERVAYWYRQNTLFFFRSEFASKVRTVHEPVLDVVHPKVYEDTVRYMRWLQEKRANRPMARLRRFLKGEKQRS